MRRSGLRLYFFAVFFLEGWVKVAVCGGGENCWGNVLWFEKKVVTLHLLFTHRRVMGNISPVKQAKILSNTFLKTKQTE